MSVGLYIHFPWCRRRCPYCDFATTIAKDGLPHEAYLDCILRELAERGPQFADKALVSIYFGGGTPSLWRSDCIAQVVQRALEVFGTPTADLEVSLESNPTDCHGANFAAWQNAGINRLLVGVQATNPTDLVTLGRDHRVGDGMQALRRSLAAGFRSVGTDVIFGVPNSPSPMKSLSDVAALLPPHISAYELTVKEQTALYSMVERKEIFPESEERLASLYEATHDLLVAQGYEHYEISSFALPGHRSRHNSLYWSGADYLGLGNGAASLLTRPDGTAVRWQNHRSTARYMANAAVAERDELSAQEFATERLWLAMRTKDGVLETSLAGREALVAELMADGVVRRENDRIVPTAKGFLYNNQISRRLAA